MQQADIMVYGPDRRLQLVAEVKSLTGASPDWVVEMRANLLGYGAVPAAPFFLLALPDVFYLWKQEPGKGDQAPPDYRIDARAALAPYTRGLDLDTISHYGLELLASSWLQDLASSDLTPETARPGFEWLFDSPGSPR